MATGRKFFANEKIHGEKLANLFLNFGDGVKTKSQADEIMKGENGRQELDFARAYLANKVKSTDKEIFSQQNTLLAAAIVHARSAIQINAIAELHGKIRTNDSKTSAELTMVNFLADNAGDNSSTVIKEAKALDNLYSVRAKCNTAIENMRLYILNHDAPVNNNALAAAPQADAGNNNNAPVAEAPRPA